MNRPIGVFDSGVGGLTVVKELLRLLPHEEVVYFGDTARVPYGTKSKETVTKFSIENAIFLMRHHVKLIVVACHTCSALSLSTLSGHFRVPIVGMIDPGVREALRRTRNFRIGVIGTRATVQSETYEREIKRLRPDARVFSAACPLFVPLVEEGWLDHDLTKAIAERYLAPLIQKKVDTVILGCTHYPLLRKVIQEVMGPKVTLVDSGREAAFSVQNILKEQELASGNGRPRHRFFVSDEPGRFSEIGERFLGERLRSVERAPEPF